jgi:hypothetical protein
MKRRNEGQKEGMKAKGFREEEDDNKTWTDVTRGRGDRDAFSCDYHGGRQSESKQDM